MALGDAYATVEELKTFKGITVSVSDDALEEVLDSASREIEQFCNRQFNLADAVSTRLFVPESGRLAYVDDFAVTSGLVIETDPSADGSFSTTWDSADYQLEPLSGVVDGQDGWPFYKIRAVGTKRFPVHWSTKGEAVLRVTAKWGWSEVPPPVKQGCLIVASETFKLREAPFGVAGSDEFGMVLRVRDNVMARTKLARYMRNRVLVA